MVSFSLLPSHKNFFCFQVKLLDGECLKNKKELSDLKDYLAKEEQLLEECRRDNMTVKQRLADTESAKETASREVSLLKRRLSELDEDMRGKEKEFQTNIEAIRRAEQKATEKVHNLENVLENTNQDLSDQKLKNSGAEGRIAGLEAQLARTEGAKNDVEVKLANLHSTLRRTLGIRAGGNG